MERITRTKNGNIVIYKDNDTFILDADKNEKLTDGQLQEIANKINKELRWKSRRLKMWCFQKLYPLKK